MLPALSISRLVWLALPILSEQDIEVCVLGSFCSLSSLLLQRKLVSLLALLSILYVRSGRNQPASHLFRIKVAPLNLNMSSEERRSFPKRTSNGALLGATRKSAHRLLSPTPDPVSMHHLTSLITLEDSSVSPVKVKYVTACTCSMSHLSCSTILSEIQLSPVSVWKVACTGHQLC
jgi:hypothetical protein